MTNSDEIPGPSQPPSRFNPGVTRHPPPPPPPREQPLAAVAVAGWNASPETRPSPQKGGCTPVRSPSVSTLGALLATGAPHTLSRLCHGLCGVALASISLSLAHEIPNLGRFPPLEREWKDELLHQPRVAETCRLVARAIDVPIKVARLSGCRPYLARGIDRADTAHKSRVEHDGRRTCLLADVAACCPGID